MHSQAMTLTEVDLVETTDQRGIMELSISFKGLERLTHLSPDSAEMNSSEGS